MRDSNIIIVGFVVFVAGWIFQITDSVIGGNAGTVLQLTGTLSIIVGIVILAIGFLKFIRRRFSTPMRT